jgi:hypothetical protein
MLIMEREITQMNMEIEKTKHKTEKSELNKAKGQKHRRSN